METRHRLNRELCNQTRNVHGRGGPQAMRISALFLGVTLAFCLPGPLLGDDESATRGDVPLLSSLSGTAVTPANSPGPGSRLRLSPEMARSWNRVGWKKGQPLPIDEMAQRASHIIVGKVKTKRSRWYETPEGGNLILTDVDIAVSRSLKGRATTKGRAATGNSVTVTYVGGTMPTAEGRILHLVVEGMPSFEKDEHVLIFAEPAGPRFRSGLFVTEAMYGKFLVSEDQQVAELGLSVDDVAFNLEQGRNGELR